MKIEEWARSNTNKIFQVGYTNSKADVIVDILGGGYKFDEITKVKNTPQELIQENDLLLYHRPNGLRGILFRPVKSVEEGIIYMDFDVVLPERVLEIWTRTSEDTFTRQWRKENE